MNGGGFFSPNCCDSPVSLYLFVDYIFFFLFFFVFFVFCLLFYQSDLKKFQLNDNNAALFVWETLRRFPPVGALSYMDIDPNTGQPNHQVYANLWMAAQDPSIFESPQEWKIRPLQKYKESSTMFADFALDESQNNLGGHSHVCPAKELSLQIFTRFLKHFSKHAYTSIEGDNVAITEMGCGSVLLQLRTSVNEKDETSFELCNELRKQNRSCINFIDERTGKQIEHPKYKPEVFDNECFSAGIPKQFCIRYNQASWPWFFVAVYSCLFLKTVIQWQLPSLGFLLYSGFRMTG